MHSPAPLASSRPISHHGHARGAPRARPQGIAQRAPWNSGSGAASRRPRCRRAVLVTASKLEEIETHVAIIGGGPAAHTAATYLGRAELQPLVFEGWMANGVAPGGQLTTTTYVENFPGFVSILGADLCDKFREQSVTYGARVMTETINRLDLQHGSPFKLWTDSKLVTAGAVIVATGAAAKRLRIPGADEGEGGFWNKGISACAVCDGSSPLFRNNPVAVVGGGDAAMEEACFLARYASRVYVIHRFDFLEASKVMQKRALSNPKIEIVWHSEVLEACGREEDDCLGGVLLRDNKTQEVRKLPVRGLFFAIGHAPATAFLGGQLQLDDFGYILTAPDSTATSVPGVFAAGDVQDRKWRQAITAAASGCMAALEAERFLAEKEDGVHQGAGSQAADGNGAADGSQTAPVAASA